MNETIEIAGPPFGTELTPLDNIAPPVYSRRVLIFELSAGYDQQSIADVLRKGLEATVDEIPTLASTIVSVPDAPGEQKGRWGLKHGGRAHLIFKDLTTELDFIELKSGGFSQQSLPAEILSPIFPVRPPPADACFIQATFIRSGLLLAISVHHVVADGSAITTIIRTLATKCFQVQQPDTGANSALPRLLSKDALNSTLLSTGDPNGKLERHSAYIHMTELPSSYRNMHGKAQVVVSETFLISPAAQARLKKLAATPTDPTVKKQSWITTHDAVCALAWRCIMSARHNAGVIPATATVSFYNPINFRAAMRPTLPDDFIGNAWLPVNPDMPLSVLTSDNGIAAAAHLLRSMTTATDNDTVRDLIGACAAAENIRNVHIRCLFDLTTTQILSTSYRKFNHQHEWGPAFGKYVCFRLPNNAFPNGSVVVLPVLKDGSWEVSVVLERGVMENVKGDELWRRFTVGPLEEGVVG